MSNKQLPSARTAILLVVLHLPLMFLAASLYDSLAPRQTLVDLDLLSLLSLIALFLLPYLAFAVFGMPWNPARARLNEPLD